MDLTVKLQVMERENSGSNRPFSWLLTVLWLVPVCVLGAQSDRITASGAITHPDLPELSGMAVSRTHPGLYWGIGDSGSPARLLAFDAAGTVRANVEVQGVRNRDWEDLASFHHQGTNWLMIADVGDNFSLRSRAQLILLAEPDLDARRVDPQRQLVFSYEDGPRDCEAVAFDADQARILLIDKRRRPSSVYALPWDAPAASAVAKRIGQVRIPPFHRGDGRGVDITAMDISSDGRRMLLLGYKELVLVERASGQSWLNAMWLGARRFELPRLPLFESAAFSVGGRNVLIGNEGPTSRLFEFAGRQPAR